MFRLLFSLLSSLSIDMVVNIADGVLSRNRKFKKNCDILKKARF